MHRRDAGRSAIPRYERHGRGSVKVALNLDPPVAADDRSPRRTLRPQGARQHRLGAVLVAEQHGRLRVHAGERRVAEVARQERDTLGSVAKLQPVPHLVGVRCDLVRGGYVLDEDRLEDAVPVGEQPRVFPVGPGTERDREDSGLPACREVQMRLDGRLADGDVVDDACFVLSVRLAEGPDVVLVVGGGHQGPVQPGEA